MRDKGVGEWRSTQAVLYISQSISLRGFNREVLQELTLGGAPQASNWDMWISTKFHKARQKAEEEAAAKGTPMPDDLQLMATISGGLSRVELYRADSKAAHLRAESNRAAADCHFVVWKRKRIVRQVEAAVSSVCTAFHENMRRFADQSHLRSPLCHR
ncbi:hypothetical protein M9H77_14437 [Catharanthus roseus]|uniref:Uncharacterized protein n=1 Tax=Catharanthus roseus TaxID=4058 RepID=A0ACC0BN84_CATRO|nr:hypothetical protein M9H77_14437 [Catharanthus roseus]